MPPVPLMPATAFPPVKVALLGGGEADLAAVKPGTFKLVVVGRGVFCPFCAMTVKMLEEKHDALAAAGVEVIYVWADGAEATTKFKADNGVSKLAFGVGLTEPQMRQLGVYVTSPEGLLDSQKYMIAEPAYFVLNAAGLVRVSNYRSNRTRLRGGCACFHCALPTRTDHSLTHPIVRYVAYANHPTGGRRESPRDFARALLLARTLPPADSLLTRCFCSPPPQPTSICCLA